MEKKIMKFIQFTDAADRMENISILYLQLTCDPLQPSQRFYSYVTNVTAYGFCCRGIEGCTVLYCTVLYTPHRKQRQAVLRK
jgi:hypothetical protein